MTLQYKGQDREAYLSHVKVQVTASKENVYLVLVYGITEFPLMLLTNKPVKSKDDVAAMFKTNSGKSLFLHLQLVPDVTTRTLQSFVDMQLKVGSTVESDGYKSYFGLKNVDCVSKKFEAGDLKWLHTAISNFKAFILDYHSRRGRRKVCVNDVK